MKLWMRMFFGCSSLTDKKEQQRPRHNRFELGRMWLAKFYRTWNQKRECSEQRNSAERAKTKLWPSEKSNHASVIIHGFNVGLPDSESDLHEHSPQISSSNERNEISSTLYRTVTIYKRLIVTNWRLKSSGLLWSDLERSFVLLSGNSRLKIWLSSGLCLCPDINKCCTSARGRPAEFGLKLTDAEHSRLDDCFCKVQFKLLYDLTRERLPESSKKKRLNDGEPNEEAKTIFAIINYEEPKNCQFAILFSV